MPRGTSAVFIAGFLQGSAFVLIPALGVILRSPPYELGNGTYGMLYVPEILGAIVASLGAGTLHARLGAHGLFRLGILANAVAMALLVGASFASGGLLVGILLAETLSLGVGFGLTNAAINRAASLLFTGATAAVTILNAVIGGATAISPLLLDAAARLDSWLLWPAFLLALWMALLFFPLARERNGVELGGWRAWRRSMIPFAVAVLIYAICEGSFGSWANVFVSLDRHFPAATGALALSLFWAGMTAARFVLGAIPDRWLPRRLTFLASPIGMAVAFVLIPRLHAAWALVAAFAWAGVACGIYYPYSMAHGIRAHPQEGTQLAGLLVGALMVGEGIGSSALGPLQHLLPLGAIYLLSALWTLPLFYLAWKNGRSPTEKEVL